MKTEFILVISVCLCFGGDEMKKKLFLDASYSYSIDPKPIELPVGPARKHDPALGISFEYPLFPASFSLFAIMNYSFSTLIGSAYSDTSIYKNETTGWMESDYRGTSTGHTVQFFVLPSFYIKKFVFSFGWRIDIALVKNSYTETIHSLADGTSVGMYHYDKDWALSFYQEPFMLRCGYVFKDFKIDLIADRLTSYGIGVSYAIKKW
jgi:hypothetical protein